MTAKLFKVAHGLWRLRLSIGLKILLSFLVIISILAGGVYYYTGVTLSDEIKHEAVNDLQSKLKGSWRLFYSRMEQMKLGMLQAGSETEIQEKLEKKDTAFLNRLIRGYSASRPYVDIWVAVDKNQVVTGSKSGQTGDYFEVKGLVAEALRTGESVQSTENVTREFVGKESPSLATQVDASGLLQIAVVPVESKGRVIGAFVTGILLNKYEWLPNAVFENLHVSSSVFGRVQNDIKVIATNDASKDIFGPLASLPEEAARFIRENKGFSGPVTMGGKEVYIAAEPILDSAGKPVGALATAIEGALVNHHGQHLRKDLLLVTIIGALISCALAIFVYRNTIRPINAITAAMDETANGKLDVRVEINSRDEFERIGEGFNHMVESIQIREARIDRFNELSKILIQSIDPDALLDRALGKLIELTSSSMGAVYLHDEGAGVLKPVASYGVAEDELKSIKIGEGLAGKCAAEQKTILLQKITDANVSLETGFARVLPAGLVWFAMNYKDKLNGVLVLGSLSPYSGDEVRHMEHLVNQITIALDNALVHKEVERLSYSDALTGLSNKRHFLEVLEKEYASAERYGHEIAVVMIDIDNFKSINDTYGHPVGDKVLMEVGKVLRTKTRSTDHWGRYGGEEFVGCVTHCESEGVAALCEKVRSGIEELEFPMLSGRKVTVSIGAACTPDERIKGMEDLMEKADHNLYSAKAHGKNRVVCNNAASLKRKAV